MRVVAADSLQVASRTAAFWLSFPDCQGSYEVLDCRDLSSSDLNALAKSESVGEKQNQSNLILHQISIQRGRRLLT